jgi:hypothetical protein
VHYSRKWEAAAADVVEGKNLRKAWEKFNWSHAPRLSLHRSQIATSGHGRNLF